MKMQDEWQQEVIPKSVTVTGSSWSICLSHAASGAALNGVTSAQVLPSRFQSPLSLASSHALCVDISPIC